MQNVGPRKEFLEALKIHKNSWRLFKELKKTGRIMKFSPPTTYALLYYYRKWKNIGTPPFNKMSYREINKKNKEFMRSYPDYNITICIIPSKKEK